MALYKKSHSRNLQDKCGPHRNFVELHNLKNIAYQYLDFFKPRLCILLKNGKIMQQWPYILAHNNQLWLRYNCALQRNMCSLIWYSQTTSISLLYVTFLVPVSIQLNTSNKRACRFRNSISFRLSQLFLLLLSHQCPQTSVPNFS